MEPEKAKATNITTREEIAKAERITWDLFREVSEMKGVDAFNFMSTLTARMANVLCCTTFGNTPDRRDLGVPQENRDMAFAISSLLSTLQRLNNR